MNILYIDHYAGSPRYGMEFRPYYLAAEWKKSGHNVLIVGASFSHLRSCQPPIGGLNIFSEEIEGVNFRWYRTRPYIGNGLGRLINIFQFLWKLFLDSKPIASEFRPDVVIASSTYPMDIWCAKYLARLCKARLIFELHDLWPASLIEISGLSIFHPLVIWCRLAERCILKNVDLIVSILPYGSKYFHEKKFPLHRICHIPNGFAKGLEGAGIQPPLLSNAIEVELLHAKEANDFVIGYIGSHGKPNALDALLDAALLLKGEGFRFILVGDGHEKERLISRVTLEKIDNVLMFPSVPKSTVPVLIEKLDCAYIGFQDLSLYNFGVSPNKLIDYMAVGVPIIYSLSSGNNLVADAQCGITVPENNVKMIAQAMLEIKNLSIEKKLQMKINGPKYVQKNLMYSDLAKRYIENIESIAY